MSPALDGGGAERGAMGWAAGLAGIGNEVTVLTYLDDAEEAPQGVDHLHFQRQAGARHWFDLVRWLQHVQAERRFDVVMGVLELSNLAVVAAFSSRRRAPTVMLTEHNINSVFLPTQGVGARAKLALSRRLYRRADGVVAISHAVATDLVVRFGVSPESLFVVPIPLSNWPSVLTLSPRSRNVKVAFAGRLESQKRPERVLDLLSELRRRGQDASAVVIGDGPLRPALEEGAKREGHVVEFTGWVADWRTCARDATCLVLPSDFEGLGLVLLEAAAVGLPAIAPSQALAVSDAMVPGVTGVLALSPSAAHLADAVLKAAELNRGQVAHCWLEAFTPHCTAARLHEACLSSTARRADER